VSIPNSDFHHGLLGAKEGIGLSALLLAVNNLVKLCAYRQVVPIRAATIVTLCTFAGAFVGSSLLVAAPVAIVEVAVVISFGLALVVERRANAFSRASLVSVSAIAAGATSGFSGTSGPLKGVAVRSLGLDRMHTIGAAAMVSAVADLTKAGVFAHSGLLGGAQLHLTIMALPVMIVATVAGRRFTVLIGEVGYTRLFWLVIGGYTVRLIL
jgi:hypothetical protein